MIEIKITPLGCARAEPFFKSTRLQILLFFISSAFYQFSWKPNIGLKIRVRISGLDVLGSGVQVFCMGLEYALIT